MSSLIAYPIRFDASPTLRLDVDGSALNIQRSVTVGRNYWMTGDDAADSEGGVNGTGDLLLWFKALLESYGGVTFNVSLSSSLRVVVELASGGTAFQLLWGNVATTLDPAIFGFAAADTASGSSVTGANLPQGLYRLRRPFSDDDRNRQPTTTAIAQALSGKVQVTDFGASPQKTRRFRVERMEESQSLQEFAPLDEPFSTQEYWWLSTAVLGRPSRLYQNELVRTQGNYDLVVLADQEARLKRDPEYRIRWGDELTFTVVSEAGVVDAVNTELDGVNEYGTSADSSSFRNLAACSWSGWVNPNDISSNFFVFSKWGASDGAWAIGNRGSNLDQFQLLVPNTSTSDLGFAFTPNADVIWEVGVWTFYCVTYNAGTVEIFIGKNGTLSSHTVTSGNMPATLRNAAEPQEIGRRGSNFYFDGVVGDHYFYNAALTQAQALQIYNGGVPLDPRTLQSSGNLIEWWRMGDGATHPSIPGEVNGTTMTLNNTEAADFVSNAP